METKFKVGDKVKIPKTKTADITVPLNECMAICNAKNSKQNYLFINKIRDNNECLLGLNEGDWSSVFNFKDLELYEEPKQQTVDMEFKVGDIIIPISTGYNNLGHEKLKIVYTDKDVNTELGKIVSIELDSNNDKSVAVTDKGHVLRIGQYPFGFKTKQEENMKTKQILLSLETAKQMYNSGIEAIKLFALNNYSKEELEAKELPKSWKELKKFKNVYGVVGGKVYKYTELTAIDNNKNMLPTESLAKATLALSQLLQLRNAWWRDWTPIWGISLAEKKYAIMYDFIDRDFVINASYKINEIFVFKTEELAREFLDTFEELLHEAKELI